MYSMRKLKIMLIVISLILFVFQDLIANYIDFFAYYDEILAIAFFLHVVIKKNFKSGYDKRDLKVLSLLVALVALGFISNYVNQIQTNIFPIAVDAVGVLKIFLIFIAAKESLTDFEKESVMNRFYYFCVTYIFVAFLFLIACYVFDLPMYDNVRYGLRAYRFIHMDAGTFGYYLMGMCFIINHHQKTKIRNTAMLLLLVLLIFTTKGPQIAFVFIYIFIKVVFRYTERLRVRFIVPIALITVLIGRYQIETYLLDQTSPRYLLAETGFKIGTDYFPLGTGFATFGSEMSRRYYSDLYYTYNLSNVWGLSPEYSGFLNDNYWPMIIGQFGFFGLIIILAALYLVFCSLNSYHDKADKTTMLSIFIVFLIGSLGAAYLTSNDGVFCFYVISIGMCKKKNASDPMNSNVLIQKENVLHE